MERGGWGLGVGEKCPKGTFDARSISLSFPDN